MAKSSKSPVKAFCTAFKASIADMATASDGEALKIVLRSALNTGVIDVGTMCGLLGAVEASERDLVRAKSTAKA